MALGCLACVGILLSRIFSEGVFLNNIIHLKTMSLPAINSVTPSGYQLCKK